MSQNNKTTANIINSVTLVGRAGSNPETRYFESGSIVTKVNVAVRRPGKNQDPDWFPVEAWGKQAEVLANYVTKGDQVGVIGELRFDRWTDKSTQQERIKPVVRAIRIELLGNSKGTTAEALQGQNQNSPNMDSLEDIPF
ncbi:single-stranded DNA-binding protein [Microcystis sp. M061S2]|jgi:single-strand DNA-binding protein|uniref:single-stranded DNA-binding protein n=1 Tax=Microcystis sp. M061S2 TaxID=2771171 RepID=UPI00258DEC0D|nr:single-stranded DNA-binding protein [Microcystis sp. M061S2]MCA2655949.1 single-stranded DNA-binding protein [Microcystis sp. M061S2]